MALDDENELIQVRLEKLRRLREEGRDPFAVERYERTHPAAGAVAAFEEAEEDRQRAIEAAAVGGAPVSEAAEAPPIQVRIAGRVVQRRVMGKAQFLDLWDESGRIQLYVKTDHVGAEAFAALELLDLGDFLGVEGTLFRTRTGEISVDVRSYEILSKALRPLPFGKSYGHAHFGDVTDVEFRYRRRHADLAVHPEVREHFRNRSLILSGIREFMDLHAYVEVETPVLQAVAGGASARPFLTHHNALDYDFKLRISLELYLKRLIIGGFEKVYEIGRVFRNEGVSTRHNPEFTLLESYEAYANLEDIQSLVEKLLVHLARRLYGRPAIPSDQGEIDLTPPWRRLPMLEGIREYAGVGPEAFESFESARAAGEKLGLDMAREVNVGGIIEKLHERFVQPHLVRPTFITDFPLETSPLAKKDPADSRFTRRFEAYVACQELANAFSEINDPLDQRERFQAQVALQQAGEAEAHPMDEEFLEALEYGMPPTGGLGIGIDRLVMVLTNTDSIRDVILFPLMRPEPGQS